jgi:hypothetical protein
VNVNHKAFTPCFGNRINPLNNLRPPQAETPLLHAKKDMRSKPRRRRHRKLASICKTTRRRDTRRQPRPPRPPGNWLRFVNHPQPPGHAARAASAEATENLASICNPPAAPGTRGYQPRPPRPSELASICKTARSSRDTRLSAASAEATRKIGFDLQTARSRKFGFELSRRTRSSTKTVPRCLTRPPADSHIKFHQSPQQLTPQPDSPRAKLSPGSANRAPRLFDNPPVNSAERTNAVNCW